MSPSIFNVKSNINDIKKKIDYIFSIKNKKNFFIIEIHMVMAKHLKKYPILS